MPFKASAVSKVGGRTAAMGRSGNNGGTMDRMQVTACSQCIGGALGRLHFRSLQSTHRDTFYGLAIELLAFEMAKRAAGLKLTGLWGVN
jgi:hypothetical protein